MATLYERYNEGERIATSFYNTKWQGQTFTIGNTGANEVHNITKVRLKLYRQGDPGDCEVYIRATSGGLPTGGNLASMTFNATALLNEGSPGTWIELELDTPCELQPDTMYVVILHPPDAPNGSNSVCWRKDDTDPSYLGGTTVWSADDSLYYAKDSEDFMFEEQGNPLGWTGKISGVTNPAKVMGVAVANIAKVKGVA